MCIRDRIKPVGFDLNKKNVPIKMHSNMIKANTDFLIIHFTPRVYFSVSPANHLLNLKKNLFNPFDVLVRCDGLNISEHSAGVSDNATNAEIRTDIATVSYTHLTLPTNAADE